MNGFIKMSNDIFNYGLTPKALFVYAYLMSKVNLLQATSATYQSISSACNMDTKTAQVAINELVSKELITKRNKYNARGYMANRYYVKHLVKDNKNWFKVEREVFSTDIKSTDFVVFCFIRKSMSSRRKEAFPSLSAICKGTGISRGRVSSAVRYLRDYSFINRVKRKYKRTKAYRHNRYMHFKRKVKKAKKNVRTQRVRTKQNHLTIILPRNQKAVNYFLLI